MKQVNNQYEFNDIIKTGILPKYLEINTSNIVIDMSEIRENWEYICNWRYNCGVIYLHNYRFGKLILSNIHVKIHLYNCKDIDVGAGMNIVSIIDCENCKIYSTSYLTSIMLNKDCKIRAYTDDRVDRICYNTNCTISAHDVKDIFKNKECIFENTSNIDSCSDNYVCVFRNITHLSHLKNCTSSTIVNIKKQIYNAESCENCNFVDIISIKFISHNVGCSFNMKEAPHLFTDCELCTLKCISGMAEHCTSNISCIIKAYLAPQFIEHCESCVFHIEKGMEYCGYNNLCNFFISEIVNDRSLANKCTNCYFTIPHGTDNARIDNSVDCKII